MASAVCPFRMMAGLVLDAQRARVHVAGQSESRAVQMDLTCVGKSCMLFVETNDQGAGACAPTLNAIKTVEGLTQLNTKIDAFAFAGVEAIEEETGAGSLLDTFGKKLRALFGNKPEQPSSPPQKPHIVKE